MSDSTTTTTTTTSAWKRWAIGIGYILAAVLGWLVATFDGNDATKADASTAISGIKTGVSYIQNGTTESTTTTTAQ